MKICFWTRVLNGAGKEERESMFREKKGESVRWGRWEIIYKKCEEKYYLNKRVSIIDKMM